MAVVETPGLREFLNCYPRMAIRPSIAGTLRLKGRFEFAAYHARQGDVHDSFALEIIVPDTFPKELPRTTETGGRIPRTGEYHVNQTDNTLCLGSPLSLLLRLSKNPSLFGFAEICLVPYLFAVSRKLQIGGPLPFGELAHGSDGILADYSLLFGLKHPERVRYVLELLGMKKRRANKLPCPCGCRSPLGRCRFNLRLHEFRKIASRSLFRKEWLGLQ